MSLFLTVSCIVLAGLFSCLKVVDEDELYPISGGNYYVSLNGNDTNDGSFNHPFRTWQKAINISEIGDTIYIKGGVYCPDFFNTKKYRAIQITKSGSKNGRIHLFGYPGERPILDCSKLPTYARNVGIEVQGDYWHFKNFDIINTKQHYSAHLARAFNLVNSNHCIIENVNIHHCQGPGIRIEGNSTDNYVINCDSYCNWDPITTSPGPGGNADGFQCGYIPKGNVNYFKGCRAWWNSDDGWDFWENEGLVEIDSCWSFWNGYEPETKTPAGDGNGIKFGKTVETHTEPVNRIVRHCLAFENGQNGFDYNGADVVHYLYNNTSYKNISRGFRFPNKKKNQIINNISYLDDYPDMITSVTLSDLTEDSNNSWNLEFEITNSNFKSLNPNEALRERKPDGSLPEIDFLKPIDEDILNDIGVEIGLPFKGLAPAIGAFENLDN